MKVHLLTAAALSLGVIAGAAAAQAASVGGPHAPGMRAGDRAAGTSGKEDNPGYLTGPVWDDSFNTDYAPQPRYYGMMQPRYYGFGGYTTRMQTLCRGNQLRYANGACHAIGPT